MISVDQYGRLVGGTPQLRAAWTRDRIIAGSATYDEFVQRLNADLDTAIHGLQQARQHLQLDGEDRITVDIVMALRQSGYRAEHDVASGGHVDLSVWLGPYSWIGEAKREGKFREGYLQLMTRYGPVSGDYSHNAGALIFYFIQTELAREKLDAWEAELSAEGVSVNACPVNPLSFYSEHVHPSAGTKFFVRTIVVALHHDPQDASGRATKARRAARRAR